MIRDENEGNAAASPNGYRIYVPMFGNQDVVVAEWEYADLSELTKLWDAWEPTGGRDAYFERWNALIERGGIREVFYVAAQR